ncbi:MAG: murein transglycosylase A [Azoarcus sp.]|jgi:membrane-bound lytic murein transglycosylase A|nr:murein transglycosylase A [Azoarcus sp.]
MNPFSLKPTFFNTRLTATVFVVMAVVAMSAACTQARRVPETGEDAVPVVSRHPVCTECAAPDSSAPKIPGWRSSVWEELPGWDNDDLGEAWPAFLESCRAIGRKAEWRAVCSAARALPETLPHQEARLFFERHFTPWQSVAHDGSTQGLITGYFEPLIRGSRRQQPDMRWPVLAPPDDMLTSSSVAAYPELRKMNLVGRLADGKVLPYWTRAELEKRWDEGRLPARALFWAEDPIDLFILQIQGSGQIELPDGSRARVGFAEHNGHPYRSIGRWLIDRGELTFSQASMEGIRQWAQRNPHRLQELLNSNPRYVFFRELPISGGPVGALGVPLHAGRSIAVDPSHIPLGAPVFLATTQPLSEEPLNRLVMAQDTGSAVKGAVRADFFWGFGSQAGEQAGRMRQQGKIWILRPKAAGE